METDRSEDGSRLAKIRIPSLFPLLRGKKSYGDPTDPDRVKQVKARGFIVVPNKRNFIRLLASLDPF